MVYTLDWISSGWKKILIHEFKKRAKKKKHEMILIFLRSTLLLKRKYTLEFPFTIWKEKVFMKHFSPKNLKWLKYFVMNGPKLLHSVNFYTRKQNRFVISSAVFSWWSENCKLPLIILSTRHSYQILLLRSS